MSVRKILVCDICKNEITEDDNNKKHWSHRWGGPVVVDIKAIPGVQRDWKWETMCYHCADELRETVNEFVAVKYKRAPKEPEHQPEKVEL
jgi:hypothetical protein